MTRPTILFYCQHSLGIGHLVRAYALAEGLAEQFDVHLLTGGDVPAVPRRPAGVRIVELPPLAMETDGTLTERDEQALERIRTARRERILAVCAELRPACVLVELFPFGRKKFAFEIVPLLELARRLKPTHGNNERARILCSVRDLLVTDRRDQVAHDQRAAACLDALFDAVLVHSDPALVRLDESFGPCAQLQVPLHYTGFVTRQTAQTPALRRQELIVSAGGGKVGGVLLRAAIAHAGDVRSHFGLSTRIVAGPLAPAALWAELVEAARESSAIVCERSVDDLAGAMASATVSISQAGYNTMMDILASDVPAVVVPFAAGRENEQAMRASRLAALGRVEVLDEPDICRERWLAAIAAAIGNAARTAATTGIDMNGVDCSRRVIARYIGTTPDAAPGLPLVMAEDDRC